MKKIVCCILLYSICWIASAQRVIDSTRIVSFVDKIILKANIDSQIESYSINSLDESIRLLTNNQYKLFLSLDYEFIGFSIGVSPKFLPDNNDNDLRGESSYNDFRFRFFLGNWAQSLEYSKTKGFYVENTGDFFWLDRRS